MSWYYNRTTGDVYQATGVMKWTTDREITLEKGAAATFGTPQTLFGPFATRADAEAAKQANPSLPDQAKAAIARPVTDVTSAIAGFGNQLVKVGLRLAEAAVGIVLLAIAANVILKQLTGVDVAGSAVRAGKQAGAAAAKAAVVA